MTTSRLTLRPFHPTDAADLFTIRGDAQAMRFWDWPADATIAQTHHVARSILADMEAGHAHYWTAHSRDADFVGLFDLSELHDASAELGFMTARRHWRQGFAIEASRALIDHACQSRLTHLRARIHTRNDATRRLLQKLGFQPTTPDRLVEVRPGHPTLCSFLTLPLEEPL